MDMTGDLETACSDWVNAKALGDVRANKYITQNCQ